jgi:hypothetical protein
MKSTLVLPALLLAAILLGAAAPEQPTAVARLELVDQHGITDSLAAHRGHVTVVMVVTARRLRNLKAWESELRERYEEIHFLRIADVPPQDPPVTREQVARKLASRVPEEVSILIDLERRWATELELDTGRPNLLLFDEDGRLGASFRGRMEPELRDRVQAAIRRLLEAR